MATVRDNDTSLWLHNKLGSNESWTSGSISSQLSAEVLRNVKECFIDLQTQVKLKLLLSFFHIPRRNIEEWKLELDEIIEVAQVDSEQWVSMLAEMMRNYPSTNCLQTDINDADENARIYYDLVQDLGKKLKTFGMTTILPIECHYLNMDVLNQTLKTPKQQSTHFTVKKKPKSSLLRSELVVKATEAAEHSAKKIPAPTIPLRTRGMPRKMTDTTPLKGIPSHPNINKTPGIAPVSQGRPVLRPVPEKKGGIKVLDINEQPLGYTMAKRRKKTLDNEDIKKISQTSEDAGTATTNDTPEYAAGLSNKPPTPPPPTPNFPPPQTPASYQAPPTPQSYMSTPPTPLSSFGQSISDAPPLTPNPHRDLTPSATIPSQMTSNLTTYLPVTHQPVNSPRKVLTKAPVQTLTKTVILQVANHQPQQVVTLSKELMEQAQEIFRTSNRATRPEKEHILKFMAGTRENPCPELGNIVTIKLSEQEEPIRQSDGKVLSLCVETHFQMNYNTGEWKVITKPPKIDNSHTQQQQQVISNNM